MVKIDLITGFLGSGKTTFIKMYAKYLVSQGLNIGILENDHGAVNVDMMLLSDLQGENCTLEMVAGGCDIDCHRRRFKTKLIAMGMSGYDRVLVEPSGVFEMDEFFDALHEEPLDRWYEIGNVIAIVDVNVDKNMSEQSQYYLLNQLASAGKAVFSKVSLGDEEKIETAKNDLKEIICKNNIKAKIDKKIDDIVELPWDRFDADTFAGLTKAGYDTACIPKKFFKEDEQFKSLYCMYVKLSKEEMLKAVKDIFADKACGDVRRIKGFLPSGDGWLKVNATSEEVSIEPIDNGQEIIIVIGEEMDEESIRKYLYCI